ncbi:UNVERIFIED_CONTAM: Ribonuclease HI [Sesamum indicum]
MDATRGRIFHANNGGAGILIQGPKGIEIEVAARLSFPVTNNEAEYEALVLGLELAHEAGARDLEIEGIYETRERTMTQYKEIVQRLMGKFDKCSILQVPRAENDKADALSKFGAAMDGIRDRKITALIREQSALTNRAEVQVVSEVGSWKDEIVKYLEDGTLPSDPIAAKRVKFRATRFTLLAGQLYKRTVDGPLLNCLDEERALYVMREIHEGKLGKKIRELSEVCLPDTPACDPNGADQNSVFVRSTKFIIVAVEYFSKWVEAEAVAKIFEKEFQDRKITEWCKELKIAQHFTAVANPQANGQTKVTNRTILQHLKTRLENKGSWVDELPGVLWAYRTTPRTATGETPFCLVYGTEAIIPVEIGEESQRIMQYDPETNQDERSFDLTIIEEKREVAYARILHHKGLMMKSHDRKIRPRQLQVGDLVLKKVEASKHVGKLEPPWEGPYKGDSILEPVKGHQLRRDRTMEPVKGHQLGRDRILEPVKGHQLGGGSILEPVKGHQLRRDRTMEPAKGHQLRRDRTMEPAKGHQLRRDRTMEPAKGHQPERGRITKPVKGHQLEGDRIIVPVRSSTKRLSSGAYERLPIM